MPNSHSLFPILHPPSCITILPWTGTFWNDLDGEPASGPRGRRQPAPSNLLADRRRPPRTLATRFAQALNCTKSPGPGGFCGECGIRRLPPLAHPEPEPADPPEGHKDILIDQCARPSALPGLAPYAREIPIALLPDFQKATDDACNALLKTLEELGTRHPAPHRRRPGTPSCRRSSHAVRSSALRPAASPTRQLTFSPRKIPSPGTGRSAAPSPAAGLAQAIRLAMKPDPIQTPEHLETFWNCSAPGRTLQTANGW